MKQQEVELVLTSKANLIIEGVEYKNISNIRDEQYCFSAVRYDGWVLLTYEQLLNADYTIKIKDENSI
jgi:hypothetical protein